MLRKLMPWRDAVDWYDAGVGHQNSGGYKKAIRCYDRALEIDPEYTDAWNNKGIALKGLGRYDEAIRCYDRALEIDPEYTGAWISKGNSLANLGRYDEAIRCCDHTLEIDPEYAIAWSNKGIALNNLGRYNEAIRCCDHTLEIDPKDAIAWHNKGVALAKLGRYDEAIRCYDRALEIDPEDAIVWNNKGIALNNLGRYDEAIRCYDRALEIYPEYTGAWNNKGNSLNKLGRYDEAIRCCDRALEIDPEDAIAWNNKGAALANLGRYDEAIQCYDHMLEIGPEYAGTWNNKGIALKGLGRYDEAIRCYDRALEIDPEHTLAKDNREKALREGGASAKDASKETLETTADTPDTSGSPHTGGARESQQSLTQSIESVTASSPVTVERTIYDPLTRDFIISSSRPLVNVRDWIDRHDPSSYWLIICVHNHGNHPIDEWGIELESSSTLQMLETTIEGSDEQVYLQNSNPKPWVVCSVLGIPHQRGIVIPRGGSRRVYFRMGSESCGVSHSVRGRFITNDIEADIREKQFRHSCDVATLGVAIQQSPEIAVQYTESALMQRYHRTTALGYLHTFRLIQEINACCCAKRFEEVHDKLYVLEDALDKVGASGRLVGLVKQLNTLDIDDGMGGGMLEIKARRAEKMCKNIIDLWASEVLQV